MPHKPSDLLSADPRWLIRLTNEVRCSRGVQSSPIPAGVQTRLNNLSNVSCVECGAEMRREHEPYLLPSFSGVEPLASLAVPQRAECLDRKLWEGERAT